MRDCDVWEWGELNSMEGMKCMWVAKFEWRTENVVFDCLGGSII